MSVSVDGRAAFDGRATTVVVATGQFRRGLDLVPRGHPGDGRAEIQVYALTRPERARAARRGWRTGATCPTRGSPSAPAAGSKCAPAARSGSRSTARAAGTVAALDVEVLPAAYRLLV